MLRFDLFSKLFQPVTKRKVYAEFGENQIKIVQLEGEHIIIIF